MHRLRMIPFSKVLLISAVLMTSLAGCQKAQEHTADVAKEAAAEFKEKTIDAAKDAAAVAEQAAKDVAETAEQIEKANSASDGAASNSAASNSAEKDK